jgi:cytochrome c peroxidase
MLIVLLGVSLTLLSWNNTTTEVESIEIPEGWPEPLYDFEKNPITHEGFVLGRKLFHDPLLSRDGTISCASCHSQYNGFTHVDHAVSHGIDDRKGTRNSPVLINLAWNNSFHWDGGVNNLEVQPLNPLSHPSEMDQSLEKVLEYLNQNEAYRSLFFQAFGDSVVSSKNMLLALAQFNASLVSSNSRYDKFMRDELEFTKQEKKGLKLFMKHCNSCHTAPLFNSNKYASNGLPIDTVYNEFGRFKITGNPEDSLKFRIPTLRNIAYTFPYMHDGRFKKLRQVVAYYAGEIDLENPYLSNELRKKIKLSSNDQKDLISFLLTLTDKEFLFNNKFELPK